MADSPITPPGATGKRITIIGLLLCFLRIGTFGFGGGMAVIALMEREFVRKRRLLDAEEFVHGVGLGQILGSFMVNAAFFIGYRLAGMPGALVSAGALMAPSIVAVIALSWFYFRFQAIPALQGAVAGLGPVVIALILLAGWSIRRTVVRSLIAAAIAAGALLAAIFHVNPVWILVCGAAAGYLIRERSHKTAEEIVESPPRNAAWFLLPVAAPAGLGALGLTFLKIGFVFFGGGFVLLPVLHERLVTNLGWLTAREFLDGVAISNLTPGPIAVLATFAGYRVAGIPGALVATAGLFAPALALMMFLTRNYEKYHREPHARRLLAGLNPAVTGLILSAAVTLGAGAVTSWRGGAACALALLLLGPAKLHPAFVLAMGAAAGWAGILP